MAYNAMAPNGLLLVPVYVCVGWLLVPVCMCWLAPSSLCVCRRDARLLRRIMGQHIDVASDNAVDDECRDIHR